MQCRLQGYLQPYCDKTKKLFPDIVSPMQRALVPGRLITDNFLVVYESYHAIKKKRVRKYGSCAVKLDMHKAYDRVEWRFLELILIQLGFEANRVQLIMECVTSVRYQVHLNNSLSEYIIVPSRGLRQGDPLSPTSFYFVRKALRV